MNKPLLSGDLYLQMVAHWLRARIEEAGDDTDTVTLPKAKLSEISAEFLAIAQRT